MLTAVFNDDERGWEGGIITSYCGEFENLDKKGHGVKLETLCMVVSCTIPFSTFNSGSMYLGVRTFRTTIQKPA